MKRNMDRTQGATSVSSKRKMTRPKLSPQAIEGVKNLEREDDSCGMGPSNIDETNFQRIKRTCTKKRYHDLQPVAAKPTEETPSVSSYCSVITSNLFNGLESQRIRRMGPSSSATLQCKESEFALKQKRLDEVEASSLKQYIEEVKKTVPVIVPVAQFTRRNLRTDSVPEPKLPLNTKKETPVYPPGSQEEKWQLQIFAKGRVNCPKCKSVGRKTVDGLKKHMESCKLNAFKCPHCEKQLKTSTGMKYHLMADHNNLPILDPGNDEFDQFAKEKLRKVLKRLGKLKCSKEGCTGSFTSIMGYVYHMKKCGKEESELEKLLLSCKHCAKPYRSRAGLVYHLKNEHGITLQKSERDDVKTQKETVPERSQSGRAKRLSAQVATFHLREIASQERHKEWPKKKVQHDLVPDDRKLKYSRPGLPSFSQEILRKWKNQVKLRKKVPCPNKGCGCFYTSVSGLKAHIGLCTMGEFESGKYRCLICKKEFNSESGVKYHINSVHSQDWFVVKTKSKKCDKLHKPHQKPDSAKHSENPSPAPDLAHTPWQDRQTSSGSSEKNRKDEPDRRKQKGNEDKVCYASLS